MIELVQTPAPPSGEADGADLGGSAPELVEQITKNQGRLSTHTHTHTVAVSCS